MWIISSRLINLSNLYRTNFNVVAHSEFMKWNEKNPKLLVARKSCLIGLKSIFAQNYGNLSRRNEIDNFTPGEIDTNEPPKWFFTPWFYLFFVSYCREQTKTLQQQVPLLQRSILNFRLPIVIRLVFRVKCICYL